MSLSFGMKTRFVLEKTWNYSPRSLDYAECRGITNVVSNSGIVEFSIKDFHV